MSGDKIKQEAVSCLYWDNAFVVKHTFIYVMHNALCEYKDADGNYLRPYYYSIYYDLLLHYIEYCILPPYTGGATCGVPFRLHLPEPPIPPKTYFDIQDPLIYIHMFCGKSVYSSEYAL